MCLALDIEAQIIGARYLMAKFDPTAQPDPFVRAWRIPELPTYPFLSYASFYPIVR